MSARYGRLTGKSGRLRGEPATPDTSGMNENYGAPGRQAEAPPADA